MKTIRNNAKGISLFLGVMLFGLADYLDHDFIYTLSALFLLIAIGLWYKGLDGEGK